MLRVLTEQRGNAFTISLHGRLADEWVDVLREYWQSVLDTVPSAAITIVISDVSFIDAEGERLLDQMWRGGTRLLASGCLNRHVIEKICGSGRASAHRRTKAPGARRGGNHS